MSQKSIEHPRKSRLTVIVGLVFLGLLATWVTITPPGIEGKLWAIGYSVCEQNPTHSLIFNGRVLPLCSRCTGMYLGTFISMIFLLPRGRAMRAPSTAKMIVLGLFALAFIVDGVNSLVATLAPNYALYPPENTLRFITGMGMGLVIGNVILPLWNQTFWADGKDEALLFSWIQFGGLIAVETLAAVLVLTKIEWIYFPAAILSTGMIPVLITMIYTLLGMVVFKRENQVHCWKEAIYAIGIGAIFALIQIGLLDLVRYSLSGTWQGFHF
jgi:uncharacterized membrane protein